MGVYIKGMEMPKRMPIKAVIFPDGRVTVRLHSGKILECKAVPVPPHGRLIDAYAFAAEMKKRQDACAAWRDDIKNGGGYRTELYYRADSFLGAMCETKLTLDKMPTIIPAEEGE